MTRMSSISKAASLLAIGIACLAGCQNIGRSKPNRAPSTLGEQPTTAVTRAQEADMQIALGRAAEKRGNLDEAMEAYKSALKRDKRRSDAYQRIAILSDRRGDFTKSAEMYKLALAASPGNPDIYCDMGYSLFLQRRWAESEQNLKQAIVLKPDHARAHNNLGLVLAANHRDQEALAEYRKAGNNEAQSHGNLAAAMTLSGRIEEARDQYKQVLAIDAASETAQARLREIDTAIARVADRSSPATLDEKLITVSVPLPPDSATPKSIPIGQLSSMKGTEKK